MPWLVLSHLVHSVSTPIQDAGTDVRAHLCLGLLLLRGTEIMEAKREATCLGLSCLLATDARPTIYAPFWIHALWSRSGRARPQPEAF